jgi:hypothetical protein
MPQTRWIGRWADVDDWQSMIVGRCCQGWFDGDR